MTYYYWSCIVSWMVTLFVLFIANGFYNVSKSHEDECKELRKRCEELASRLRKINELTGNVSFGKSHN